VQESSASPSRGTPDYGKFYKTTYMELKDGYKRGPSINADASERLPRHFHRPGTSDRYYISPCETGTVSLCECIVSGLYGMFTLCSLNSGRIICTALISNN